LPAHRILLQVLDAHRASRLHHFYTSQLSQQAARAENGVFVLYG